jgi:dTDP-glucose 4,6-dehydratase
VTKKRDLSLLSGAKVLVTGAGGFIGSHLIEELVREGAKVRCFIRYTSRADIGALKWVESGILEKLDLYFGDLRDLRAVQEALRDIDIVFHLGAVISVPYSFLHPFEVVETNVIGSLNIFEAARALKPSVVVHLSTSEVYGTAQYIPIDENHPRKAQSPYAASKIGADELARSFHLAYGVPIVVVRPFNTYGPRQSQRAVIPTITVQALKNEVVKLGFVESIRDFLFVKDTVEGLMLAAIEKNAIGKEIQLATGFGHRIMDVAKKILEILGVERVIEIKKERMRPGKSEVLQLIGSPMEAKEILGWEPSTSLDDGLQRTVNWIRDNLDFYEREIL